MQKSIIHVSQGWKNPFFLNVMTVYTILRCVDIVICFLDFSIFTNKSAKNYQICFARLGYLYNLFIVTLKSKTIKTGWKETDLS